MPARDLSKEQHLLIASGLIAVALVGWIVSAASESLTTLVITMLFAVAYLGSAYGRHLKAPEALIVSLTPVMLLLSLALLALVRDTTVLILAVVMMATAPYNVSQRSSVYLFFGSNFAYVAVLVAVGIASTSITAWASLVALQGFALSSSLARLRETQAQEELARQNTELRAARALIAQKSQAEERLRIAGDLHDSIGHGLTALRLQLAAVAHQAPPTLRTDLTDTQNLAAQLLDELRAIVRRTAEPKGNDLASMLLELSSLTPEVQIDVPGKLPVVPQELAQQLLFCAQEAIHNAIRHGGATQIMISETPSGLSIRDNGSGLRRRPIKAGFGLTHINSRLAPFNGSATLAHAKAPADEPMQNGCDLQIVLDKKQFA